MSRDRGLIGLGMCDSCHALVTSLALVWVGVSPRYLCSGCAERARERIAQGAEEVASYVE